MWKDKNVCEHSIKNFAKICHQSNYYLCDVSTVQQVRYFAVWSTNEPKSIKIIAEASSKSVSHWIFAYSYFAFDNFLKLKNTKKIKNVKT